SGWKASSHPGLRLPPRNAALKGLEPIATVGVVLHLADVAHDASLVVEVKDTKNPRVTVPLQEVLAGKSRPLWDGAAVLRRVSTSAALTTGHTEDDFPAAAYGPDGTLWVAYVSYHVKDDARRI